MEFNEKLKRTMQSLGISQAQLVSMTGIGKSSISQYLSGKNVPTEDRQRNIAVSLGLDPDHFKKEEDTVAVLPHKEVANGVIPRLDVTVAAKAMGVNHHTVRKGLQQGVFPWGYGIKTSENRWVYFINALRFQEIEGVVIGNA